MIKDLLLAAREYSFQQNIDFSGATFTALHL